MPELSVVAPLYNESQNVQPLVDWILEALSSYAGSFEVILVDDGSRDDTWNRIAAAAAAHPQVHGLRLGRNVGQTAAMMAGFDHARGRVVVSLDGDLQNDPRDIPALVARLLGEDLDLVAGWRQRREDGLLLRKLPSRVANRVIRRATGLRFHDLGCSLKAFRGSVVREVRLYGEMHRFIPAWLATVTSADRMAELPVSHHARARGKSKYGLSRTIRVILDLVAVTFFLRYRARPGHFFGAIGLGVLGVGAGILAYLLALKLAGESVGGRPLLSLGFFCVIGGVQLLTTGVLAELLIRVYYEGGRARPYHAAPEAPLADGAGWHAPRR